MLSAKACQKEQHTIIVIIHPSEVEVACHPSTGEDKIYL